MARGFERALMETNHYVETIPGHCGQRGKSELQWSNGFNLCLRWHCKLIVNEHKYGMCFRRNERKARTEQFNYSLKMVGKQIEIVYANYACLRLRWHLGISLSAIYLYTIHAGETKFTMIYSRIEESKTTAGKLTIGTDNLNFTLYFCYRSIETFWLFYFLLCFVCLGICVS